MKDEGKTKKELIQELQDLRAGLAETKRSEDGCKEAEQALRVIVEGVSAGTGDAFFHSLVEHLAKTLKTAFAFVGELSAKAPDTIDTIAVFADGTIVENFDYTLAHTPCQNVVGQILRCYPRDIQQQFPDDHLLAELGVESYAGTPLFDSSRRAIGLMVVMDRKPFENVGTVESLLQVFAIRASSELERKQVEDELVRARERLEFLLKNSPAVIYTCTYGGNWSAKYMSTNLKNVLGYEAQENLDNPSFWADRIHPDDKSRIFEGLKERETNDHHVHEYRFLHKDGTYRWMRDELRVVRDTNGRPLEGVGYWIDITKRRQVEEALQQSEEKYRRLFEHANDGIFIIDPETRRFLDVNEIAARQLGYARSELLSLTLNDIYFAEDAARNDAIVHELKQKGSIVFEHRQRRKDGTELPVEISSRHIEVKQQVVFQSIVRDITERKHAEAALRQSEKRFRSIFNIAAVGVAIVDAEGTVLDANDADCAFLGYPRDELIGMHYKDFTHPDDYDIDADLYGSLLAGERSNYMIEKRYVRKDREVVWGRLNVSLIRDHLGKPQYTVVVCEDITERKRAEEALREERDRAQQYLDVAGVMLVAIDANQTISLINRKGAEILGHREEEIIGNNWFDTVIPQRMKEDVKNVFDQLMAGKITPVEYFENPIVNKGGEERMIAWRNTILTDGSGAITGTLSSGEDITERKKADEALKLNETRLRALLALNRMTDASLQEIASFVLEQGLQLTRSTVGFVGLMSDDEHVYTAYALSPSAMKDCAIIEQPLHFVIEEAGIWADAVRTRMPVIINEYAAPHPGKKGLPGGHMPLTRLLSIPFMEGERVVGVAAVANKESAYGESDVQQLTLLMSGMWRHIERMKMEDELQKAQKLESIGLLAGGLAHDFNNLLTGLLGNIELAKMYAHPNDKVYEKLDDAGQIFLRAKDLTQQLLTFSRGGEPLKKIVPLKELVQDSATFCVRGSNVRCEFSIAHDLCSAEVDEGQISQVINNLVMNAAQAMPSGGTVDVLCNTVTVSPGDSPPLPPGAYLKISIRDHGIGIPKEHLPKIFDPYFTTKQQGSGLGLATSYSIIKKHRGHISVESDLGVGTTFHIYLPASDQSAPQRKAEDAPVHRGRGKILLMDDDETVRQVGGEMLNHLGYEVTFAEDGEKAIQLYEAAKESGAPYDVVIMDLTIPGGIGGKQAVHKLLALDPDVKVIVSSGYSDDPVMAEYKHYGFSGVVAKPYKVKELGETVYRVMKSSPE